MLTSAIRDVLGDLIQLVVGVPTCTLILLLVALPLRLWRTTRPPWFAVGLPAVVLFIGSLLTNGISHAPMSLVCYWLGSTWAMSFYLRRNVRMEQRTTGGEGVTAGLVTAGELQSIRALQLMSIVMPYLVGVAWGTEIAVGSAIHSDGAIHSLSTIPQILCGIILFGIFSGFYGYVASLVGMIATTAGIQWATGRPRPKPEIS